MDSRGPGLSKLVIAIRRAGEMASAVAWRLYTAHSKNIFMMDIEKPRAVRRRVSFCEAIIHGAMTVEGVSAARASSPGDVFGAWEKQSIAVIADPGWTMLDAVNPDVCIDAILAKKNMGTSLSDAGLVIGLGPGFTAGRDVHYVIETNRGHKLGRVIDAGPADPNTGVPGPVNGVTEERVLRSPADGIFHAVRSIGDIVEKGECIGDVDGAPMTAKIGGVIRGLIMSDIPVTKGLKMGDIDPRGDVSYCATISDKARAIGGSVLEAIMRKYNA